MSRTSPSAASSASIRRRSSRKASSDGANRAKWSSRPRLNMGAGGGALELGARLLGTTEFLEQIAPHRGQLMVVTQRWLGAKRLDQLECRLRAESHSDGDRTVQLDDWRRYELGERVVERDDALPIRVTGVAGARVAGGDRGLERVRPERAARALRALERGEPAADEHPIPAGAVLVE